MLVASLAHSNAGETMQILFAGITAKNVERLKDGKPIAMSRKSHGVAIPENITIVIAYGETEQHILEELRKLGLLDEKTVNLTGTPLSTQPVVQDSPELLRARIIRQLTELGERFGRDALVWYDEKGEPHRLLDLTWAQLVATPPVRWGNETLIRAYPEGRLNNADDGELTFAIGSERGRVVLDFGKQIKWVAMAPSIAMAMAISLIDEAVSIDPSLAMPHMPFCKEQDREEKY